MYYTGLRGVDWHIQLWGGIKKAEVRQLVCDMYMENEKKKESGSTADARSLPGHWGVPARYHSGFEHFGDSSFNVGDIDRPQLPLGWAELVNGSIWSISQKKKRDGLRLWGSELPNHELMLLAQLTMAYTMSKNAFEHIAGRKKRP